MKLTKRYSISKRAAFWQALGLALLIANVGLWPVVLFPGIGVIAGMFEGIITGTIAANVGIWWYETRRQI